MEQLWALAQAQEAARLAVEQLIESAQRSRVHKQQCHKVAHAGREVFARLEAAVRERTGDTLTLCSAAARLYSVVNNSRACVEHFGNPSRLGRLTATFFQNPRKNGERALSDHCESLLELAEEYAGLWASAPLRVATSASVTLGNLPQFASTSWFGAASRKSGRDHGSDALPPGSRNLQHALSTPLAMPWTPLDHSMPVTPHIRPRGALLTNSPGTLGLSPQPSNLRMVMGPGSESMPLSPSAGSEEADTLRSLPFGQRSVRPSDGSPVQRLCFMRGAGGESAAVQLMVVLNRQVEVYSAALDSFHSDTPLDIEAQQVTATALYEPTIDLITGHRGGTVLVYGRVGAVLSASASSLRGGVLSAAAAAATAAQQAGVPLVIRLSRAAVTALHCVPAIELEAASAAAAAASTPAAPTAAADAPSAGADDEQSIGSGPRGGGGSTAAAATPAGPSAEAVASGAIGCCTADDVLLFTGDALGRVMAVRYSRVQPEVLATTVFTTARRTASRSNGTPPSDQPASPEITGLLYRSGCLLVSTSTDMYSIRVITATGQVNGAGTGGGAKGDGGGEAEGGASTAAAADVNRNAAGTAQGAALPQSSSVNLLSPAASAMPLRNGGSNGMQAALASGVSAAVTNAAAAASASAAAAAAATGSSGEPIIRRGTLNLSTTLVDSFPFADFDSCTALIAIDWPVPGGAAGHQQSATAHGGAAAPAAATAVGPCTPRGSNLLGGGLLGLGLGAHMTETTSLACWAPNTRGEAAPGGSGSAAAAAAAAAANGAAAVGGASGAVSLAGLLPAGRSPKFVSARQAPWRMLSAHMNGQLLMWDVTAGRLQLICAIGQPGPPIVNVFTFPELGTMVELLSTGHIRVGPLPTSSLAPPINPLGNVPVWQFGRASMRAHRGRLTAGAALANCIATGSRAGGVKVHSAAELRAQAARQNVAFLSPWPGAAAAAAASGRSAASTSPTASVPYMPSDHYHPPRGRTSRTGGGPGSEDQPPFHGGMPGGPPGGPSTMTSGPGSLASTAAVHAPYLPNGNAYPPFSRMPSGHASHAAGLPSSYPFMSQAQVNGSDGFGSGYPMMSAGSGGMGGGGPPHQRVPGPSGGGGGEPHVGLSMASQPSPASAASARGLPATAPVAAPTPFANSALESPDSTAMPRAGTGGGGGGGAGEAFRHPLPNGLGHGGGLANGHGHGAPRSEDSLGNVSVGSSMVNNGVQKLSQPRSSQGLRSAAPPHTTQPSALARVSERPAGDTTPTRPPNKVQPLTQTERALMGLFAPTAAAAEEPSPNNKLPTVGPVGYDSGEAAADAAAASEKSCPDPASPAPSQEWQAHHPTPHYPLPHHHHHQHHQPHQHYGPGPTSPTPASSGASVLPHTVVRAAAESYGTSYGGGHVGMPPASSAMYPAMPTVGTDALPPPPPHMSHGGSLVMSQGQRSQVVPFSRGMDSHPGYNSPPPQGHMYGSPSPLQSGGGAPPGMMMYGPSRTSELGAVPPPPASMFAMPGGQHVPGPQMGNGRRLSNLSEYEWMSGRVTPFERQDSGEVGLPPPPVVAPPPVVRPPPPCDPPTSRDTQPSQLSQNCFIPAEEVRNIEQIGEGAEGTVYRGRWHHIDVAVKEMHPSFASFNRLKSMAQDLTSQDDPASANKDLANLIKEVAALIDLGQHPNIIRFIGVCASPPRIVTEYYKMGSLYCMLKEARQGNIRMRQTLAWDKRLIMLKDIAAGMAFLHSRDYIHGDLRSPNVFVTEDQHLKLGDFGFARILGKAQDCVVPARLTNPRWQAPEVYDMADPIATTAADVYSFGIIMYELLTFRLPYDDEPEDEVVKLRHTFTPSWRPHVPPDRQLPVQKNVHREGHLPPLQAYKAVMMDCWAENPADRPGFHKIATRLNALCHWQSALTVIQRGLHYRQMSRHHQGSGGPDASHDVTPTCATPTSVSSPTSRTGPSVPTHTLHHILKQVASTLEQEQEQRQQQDPELERHLMDGLRHDENPLTAVSSPAAPPLPFAAGAAAAPLLPLLPQLPPLQAPAPAAQVSPPPPPPQSHQVRGEASQRGSPNQHQQHQQQHVAAEGTADSPTRSRPTAGFVSRPGGVQEGGVKLPPPAPFASGSVTARRFSAAAAALPLLAVSEPPDLETAPTLASTGSRPLHVSAASMSPPFPPGTSMTARSAAPAAPAPSNSAAADPPPSPPAFPALRGNDSHALLSPFQSMRLSDDEEDGPGMGPRPTAAAAAAAAAAGPSAAAALPADPNRVVSRPQAGLAVKPPGAVTAHEEVASPLPLGTSSSVAVPAAALVPPRSASLPAAPPPPPPPALASVVSVALPAPVPIGSSPSVVAAAVAAATAVVEGAALQRTSSFQPAAPVDPLEMRTAFHMGMGFSIDDDEEEDD